MAEMVERVAKALMREMLGDERGWQGWADEARAVIEALREPTEEMMVAAAEALERPRVHVGHRGSDAVAGAVDAYRAMIDAALSEP